MNYERRALLQLSCAGIIKKEGHKLRLLYPYGRAPVWMIDDGEAKRWETEERNLDIDIERSRLEHAKQFLMPSRTTLSKWALPLSV